MSVTQKIICLRNNAIFLIFTAINCTDPKCIENSTLVVFGYSVGTINSYFCHPGYYFPGTNETRLRINCQTDGNWMSDNSNLIYTNIENCERKWYLVNVFSVHKAN